METGQTTFCCPIYYRRSLFIKRVIILLTLISLFIYSLPALAVKGDVNNDGYVNGKDALKIMLVLEDRIKSPDKNASFWEKADVYPLKDKNGTLNGDGEITRKDAQSILQSSVGLISFGEITGDFSGQSPEIDSFSPHLGSVGTEITIKGRNFIANDPVENIVLIGGIPTEIKSVTGKKIVVEVPKGAKRGTILVSTPGGECLSPFKFTITKKYQGKLDAGMDPGKYRVSNKFGEMKTPDGDGQFSMNTPRSGVNTITAVPKDGSEKIFLDLDINSLTEKSKQGQASRSTAGLAGSSNMDFTSTAQGLVFITPYLITSNPQKAEISMSYIKKDPKVEELAELLKTLYKETDKPLEDSRFIEMYREAVQSVVESMPEHMTLNLDESGKQSSALKQSLAGEANGSEGQGSYVSRAPAGTETKQEKNVRSLQSDSSAARSSLGLGAKRQTTGGDISSMNWKEWELNKLGIRLPDSYMTHPSQKDADYQVDYPGIWHLQGKSWHWKEPGTIVPKCKPYNPLDWYVVMSRVDNVYESFPLGLQHIEGVKDECRNIPSTPVSSAFVSADSVYNRIDIC